jgi:DHA1 family inner membrane transport protein
MLVSAYAFGVTLGAPVMTLLLGATRRRQALIILMAIYTLGNLAAAAAPSYATLMAARVLTSLAHGAFFGLGAMVATSLVPPERRASAVSAMFMGLTIANVGGVPMATWLGQQVGWRMAFVASSLLGVATMVGLWWALHRGEAHQRPDVRRELKVLARHAVLNALATTVGSSAAMFALYTYVAPVLAHLTHVSGVMVTVMLAVIGVGFSLGNVLTGRLADRSVNLTLLGFLLAVAALSFVFPLAARTPMGAGLMLLLWGAATFGVCTPVQMRVMQEAHDAPALASSVNIGAFNLGNAVGAAAGGAVLSAGLDYAWIGPMGGVLALSSVGLVLWRWRANAAPALAAS